MNIAILGCGHIANRIAKGIQFSKGNLYAVASRDVNRAKEFACKYQIPNYYTYEECFNDENIDLIYIATVNPTHYELTKKCLNHHKHVICEKPFLENQEQIHELFELARKNNCFLMEAHKTCFTPLNQLVKSRIHEIGDILSIEASYSAKFDIDSLSSSNLEEKMGGSFYDVGVYPICFANYYNESNVKEVKFNCENYKNYLVDFECECEMYYENNVVAHLKSSWIHEQVNKGIIIGTKGTIEMINYWKNDEALITINGKTETIHVHQNSDFQGEIDHAIDCISNSMLESPIMSEKASCEIVKILELMKKSKC